ncbi:NUDIX hydrolase [Amaricoccus tamworthensis]|uniref:NUDIX hydrolase n=1 Tax=Amaricoccus tamworthensis TaxID=57002 RepID=UPI003C7E1864
MTSPDIRNAATVILLRRDGDDVRVLMGQRGRGAVFMPDKFVFPGGAIDEGDFALAEALGVQPVDRERLERRSVPGLAGGLAIAAVREVWEETGLKLAHVGEAPTAFVVPETWARFFAGGLMPNTGALRFFFRAVTPKGRPRRFDARFFLADADALFDTLDDHTEADGELRHLQWLKVAEARKLSLPFITEVVLSELENHLKTGDADRKVPFFDHDDEGSHFRLL